MITALSGRIHKNFKRLNKVFSQKNINAYRLYDRDLPDIPVIIDIYHEYAVIFFRFNEKKDSPKKQALIKQGLIHILSEIGFEKSRIIFRVRRRQSGPVQYQQLSQSKEYYQVQEGPIKYFVNLNDYLDTGLFLDHRPMRAFFRKSSLKNLTLLNLFSYTGSISVAGASAGAQVTSVDSSHNYLKWSQDNFRLNNLAPCKHQFVCEDVLKFLKKEHHKQYDLIFLDPPTFSNSKKRDGTFDIQRDHPFLIKICLTNLAENGVLYFSNNKRGFKLNAQELKGANIQDITNGSIPMDFRDKKVHRLYKITAGEKIPTPNKERS